MGPIESGALERAVLDALAEGVCVVDAAGAIISCNAVGADILGLTLDELSGRFAQDDRFGAVHPDGRPMLPAELPVSRTIASGEAVNCASMGIETPDGTRRWLSVNTRVLELDDRGKPALVVASFSDVTEAHQTTLELRGVEARLLGLIENSWDVIIVLDETGRLTFANHQVERLLGYSNEEILGQNALELVHPDDLDAALASLGRALAGQQEGRIVDLRLRHHSGRWVWVEVVGNNLLDDAAVGGIVVNVRDISERRMIEHTLREAQTLFAEVFEHGPIGLALVTPTRRIFRANPALARVLGYTEDELADRTITELTHVDDRAANNELFARLFRGERVDSATEQRFVRRDDSPVWCRINIKSVYDADGDLEYGIAQIEDISEQRATAERLEFEARHDSLTDLPTRKHLLERIERSLRESRRGGHGQVAVLFIDLDHFKQVNDTLGHVAGDELLAKVAREIQAGLRGSDVAGRFGGDEFVVLCPHLASPMDATIVADRIRRRLGQPFIVRGTEVFIGASIGIAIADHQSEAATLLTEADTAAYRAKERGRNRVEIFGPELRTTIARRVEIESSLRHAIENDELVLHYQPIVAVGTGAISGFEALVRWDRPGHGIMAPVDFLPLAEERGLIVGIGRWITETAFRQLSAWDSVAPRPLHVAINLSPRQLASGHLVREVRDLLDQTGVDPARICFEITENALVDDTEAAIQRLQELRSLGVELAIDDFGTGYSSLSYLRRLPVSIVKIDRSFVLALGADREGSTIVASVIDLAHALGMRIVAEGVESVEHVAALVNLDCDEMQGYYFSRPVPADAATALVIADGDWGAAAAS